MRIFLGDSGVFLACLLLHISGLEIHPESMCRAIDKEAIKTMLDNPFFRQLTKLVNIRLKGSDLIFGKTYYPGAKWGRAKQLRHEKEQANSKEEGAICELYDYTAAGTSAAVVEHRKNIVLGLYTYKGDIFTRNDSTLRPVLEGAGSTSNPILYFTGCGGTGLSRGLHLLESAGLKADRLHRIYVHILPEKMLNAKKIYEIYLSNLNEAASIEEIPEYLNVIAYLSYIASKYENANNSSLPRLTLIPIEGGAYIVKWFMRATGLEPEKILSLNPFNYRIRPGEPSGSMVGLDAPILMKYRIYSYHIYSLLGYLCGEAASQLPSLGGISEKITLISCKIEWLTKYTSFSVELSPTLASVFKRSDKNRLVTSSIYTYRGPKELLPIVEQKYSGLNRIDLFEEFIDDSMNSGLVIVLKYTRDIKILKEYIKTLASIYNADNYVERWIYEDLDRIVDSWLEMPATRNILREKNISVNKVKEDVRKIGEEFKKAIDYVFRET